MIEIKQHSSSWDSPISHIVPTENLTPNEQKKLDRREALIKEVMEAVTKPDIWMKINNGIYRGTIFRMNRTDKGLRLYARVDRGDPADHVYSHQIRGKDTSKKWKYAKRRLLLCARPASYTGDGAGYEYPIIKMSQGWIFPEFFGSDIDSNISFLMDYNGPEVFQMDQKKRPPTFTDRLDQEVNVGDLVVVALNYGAGLDVCLVRGFADENRVVIESVETGSRDRIPLIANATKKIMKMPNSLKDTALMIKLGRQ